MATVHDQVRSDVLLELCIKQRDDCQHIVDKVKGSSHYESVCKALISAELSVGLLQVREVDRTKAVHQSLQKYIQSVLDLTYYHECCLVDNDFPEASVIQNTQELIDQFATSIKVCGDSYPQLIDVLGEEVMECLHWRIGALMYMVAHTIMNDDKRRETVNMDWLRECCYVGVLHLRKIFEVRTSLAAGEDYITNDARLPELLKHGIRSDTHMLALAYGGELSYWFEVNRISSDKATPLSRYPELYRVMEAVYSLSEVSEQQQQQQQLVDVVSIGMEFLLRYIEVAKNSLSMQSWKCDRSEEILVELKKMQKQ